MKFKSWCFDFGKSSRGITHTFLDGGVCYIPDKHMDDFYRRYAECIQNGDKISCVEMKTPVFRFFIDLDYEAPTELAHSSIQLFSMVAQETIGKLLPSLEPEGILCTTIPKTTANGVKTGLHIIWKNVFTNSQNAKHMFEHIKAAVEQEFGPGPWGTALDAGVYRPRAPGLRLRWSVKPDNPLRFYEPKFHITRQGVFPYNEPMEQALRETSLRVTNVQSVTVEAPFLEPEIVPDAVLQECNAAIKQGDIERFISIEFSRHRITKIRKLQKVKGKKCFIAFVDCKYCLNHGKEHRSNNIYFTITPNGVSQKCFCRCAKIRAGGMECKDFTSTAIPLPTHLELMLFKSVAEHAISATQLPQVPTSQLPSDLPPDILKDIKNIMSLQLMHSEPRAHRGPQT